VRHERAVEQVQGLSHPPRPLMIGDRDRVFVLGERVTGRPLPLRDRDSAELLTCGAESLHVPPSGERVVHGHAAESVAGGQPAETYPLCWHGGTTPRVPPL